MLFFWAHWCADCKAEGPILADLAREFGPKGFVVIAPTQRYGYTADDDHAPPAKEKEFIEKVYEHYYAQLPNAGIPLDTANFERFGVSTTPTLVLVDRRGMVRLYHPGLMDAGPLRAAVQELITPAQSAALRR